jgi:SAM-dependent methyltransferase
MEPIQSDMLICPQCSRKLQPSLEDSQRLDCQNCPLSYPLRDGVPVLVIKQASARRVATDDEFERLITEALQAPFSGWDFSWLESRRGETEGPHAKLDYERRAREAVSRATAVLDLGTGGGELLARLAPFPSIAIATEAYPPSVVVAARRLAPLGVKVVCTDGGCHDSRGPQPQNRWPQRRLPFADATFDLVLVSSVSFCPREVYRVLKSGGTLLTSQAGAGKYGPELVDLLEGTPPEWSLPENRWDIDATLDEAGFLTVEKLEYKGANTYRDIGAVVYYLKAVPWAIIDFDVDRYRERLYKLHLRMKAEGGLTLIDVHRLIEVRKP